MIVGLPKEIKDNENRVGLVPAGVAALTKAGHEVFVEKDAGVGSGSRTRSTWRPAARSSRRPTRSSRRRR